MLALALSMVLLQAGPQHAPPMLRISILVEDTPESPGLLTAALAETARVSTPYGRRSRFVGHTGRRNVGDTLRVKFAEAGARGGTDKSLGSIPFLAVCVTAWVIRLARAKRDGAHGLHQLT
jgi:hypothetical protein